MTIAVLTINPEGEIISAGGATSKLFGYQLDEIVGQRLMSLLHLRGDTPSQQLKWLAKLPETGSRLAAKHKTDGEVPISACVCRLPGNLFSISCTPPAVDWTSLRYSRKMVAMFTHDLRTPLNSILGFTQLLEMGAYGTISQQSLAGLQIAERNIIKVLKLIEEILDFEKLDSGYNSLAVENVSVQTVLHQALDATHQAAQAKGIYVCAQPQDFYVLGDEEQTYRVLVNLIDNAIKFSPPNTTVTVKCEAVGNMLEIAVSDCGPGIAREFQNKVFEPFFQIEPSKSVEQQGVGLGLAIAKAVVDIHGGKIGVISEPGSGSIFWLQLPMYRGEPAPSVIRANVPLTVL